MKIRKHLFTFLMESTLTVALSLAPVATLWADPVTTAPPPSMAAVQSAYGRLPLSFEANHGQVDAQVRFLARGKGYTLFLTPTESVMVLQQRDAPAEQDPRAMTDPTAFPEAAPIKQVVVRMRLEGANPSPAIDGMEQLPGIVNYFIGNDPAKWRTKIPTYAKVQYQEPYPGIALAYYANQGQLEYDFIVSPGADPNQIKLAFEGASDIRVAESGDLLVTTELSEVRLQKPIVYQLETDGHKTLVAGRYVVDAQSVSLHASRTTSYSVGFQLASYDQAKPVVIDPVLFYSTYLGGDKDDQGNGIAVDQVGNAYVTGRTKTLGSGFPGTAGSPIQHLYGGGSSDAFVTKLNAAGTALFYSTYLGGDGSDAGNGIAVDALFQAYVTGQTSSANFPTFSTSTTGAYQTALAGTSGASDAFVTKLSFADPSLSLVYSTYLGGSDADQGFGIAVDAAGQAYVTGETRSTDFPTRDSFPAPTSCCSHGLAFVTKLNDTGSSPLVYSTYLGGSEGEDFGRSIAVDAAGQAAYVTGQTNSTDFPTKGNPNPYQDALGGSNGLSDAFVAKITTTTALNCNAAATPTLLWPPNHKFVTVAVTGVTDSAGNAVGITVTKVFQDEPVNDTGDGNTSPDAMIQGGVVFVRAERSGTGDGRVYHLSSFEANGVPVCNGVEVTVSVPHDMGQGRIAIDGGALYDSTLP